jgi:AAA15 family ATPase/GTPase
MLVNIRVENFLSFRDEIEFTALATPERQHRDRVFRWAGGRLNILPTAAFYGGNGAGKSNFYHALVFARRLVLKSGTKPEDAIERDPFRLDPACLSLPSRFGFDLLIGDQYVRYAFAVTTEAVVEESLAILRQGTERVVFHRTSANGEAVWSSDSFKVLKLSKDDEEFLRFKTRDTLPNQLFLAALRGRKIPLLEEVGDWFRNRLVLLDPHCDFRPVEIGLMQVEDFRLYCVSSLDKAGTGIGQIKNEPTPLESIPIPEKIREEFIKRLQADKQDQMLMLRLPDRTRFLLGKRDGKIEAFRLTTFHRNTKGQEIGFEMADESEGTERLIDLLPVFFELTSSDTDKVFFIDELDRSLHTHLTRGLIESFLESRTAASRAQLLFTTHDPLLLDQELFRRDEIWFFDKLESGSSKLTALSDFKGVRYDKDIRKNYLLGRFAGVPAIRRLPRRAAGSAA